MSLGKRLKYEREKKNWSQVFVANKLGITNTVLSNYERDYRDPDTETLRRLAELYQVSTDYLLTGKETNKPPREDISDAFYKFGKLTDKEKEFLEKQLEIFREMNEDD